MLDAVAGVTLCVNRDEMCGLDVKFFVVALECTICLLDISIEARCSE